MFSFLTSKPLILALILSLSCNALLFGVSKHLYDAKAEAIRQTEQLKQTLSEQLESSNKAETACIIGHFLTSELQEEKKALESVEKEALGKVSKLTDNPKTQEEKDNVETNPVVPLDGRLPDSLRGVLQSTFDSVQGQGTRHP